MVAPHERLQSSSYKEISRWVCTLASFREGTAILNRMLHRRDGEAVRTKTLSDSVAREGLRIESFQEGYAREVLREHGFCPETCLPEDGAPLEAAAPQSPDIPEERIHRAIEGCNASGAGQPAVDAACLQCRMEEPSLTTYVSIDDIGVTRQKDGRRPGEERETKYVENTVVHVARGTGHYVLAGIGMAGVMRLLVAFLLSNGLMQGKNLVFFTDGARNIRGSLERLFPYRPYRIILDWYHLEKKCREYLSNALKGKDVRNQVSEAVLRHLWAGDVGRATDCLLHLDGSLVKSREWLERLVQYLDRNYSYIPCYALRKELGLRNSSNPVEKANDTTVAQRQKHNGMSWSKGGSSAMTHIRAVYLNGEGEDWNKKGTLRFQLSYSDDDACAA
nr:UPF0236 family protein [uncultured Acetatifactor sp.]